MAMDLGEPPPSDGRPAGAEVRVARAPAMVHASPDLVLVIDPAEGRVDVLGADDENLHSRSEVVRGSLEEFFPEPGIRSRVLGAANRTVETGRRQYVEYEVTSSVGRRVFEGCTFLLSRQPVARVLWVAHDITERRDMASRLREREALLDTLVESLPFDLWLLSPEGRYTLANSIARQHWGDSVGKRPADMNARPEVLKIWESNNARALAGEVVRGEVKYRQNGEERTYLNILAPVRDGDELYGVVGLNLDVTDEKRLALELERHQRLESVGVLAGGIAHDFNNYLTVILSGLSALQMRAEQPVDQAAILADLKQAALSARALTRQLLTFAKGSAPVRAPTDIGQIVSEAAGLAIRGSSCLLETQIDPELPLVDADAEQLRQVVHNLVLNAVQSMSTGGMVRVVVGRTGGAQGGPDLVEIAVHDQGIGIPQELLGRVLEPYFTTKQEGQGLGLAICYSIVKKHGGCLSIDSKVGQGTKVFVRLPCSGAESVTAPEAPGANRQDSS
jgi:PAS domain S-box-containing protein